MFDPVSPNQQQQEESGGDGCLPIFEATNFAKFTIILFLNRHIVNWESIDKEF
jgi:hypothetical protein